MRFLAGPRQHLAHSCITPLHCLGMDAICMLCPMPGAELDHGHVHRQQVMLRFVHNACTAPVPQEALDLLRPPAAQAGADSPQPPGVDLEGVRGLAQRWQARWPRRARAPPRAGCLDVIAGRDIQLQGLAGEAGRRGAPAVARGALLVILRALHSLVGQWYIDQGKCHWLLGISAS